MAAGKLSPGWGEVGKWTSLPWECPSQGAAGCLWRWCLLGLQPSGEHGGGRGLGGWAEQLLLATAEPELTGRELAEPGRERGPRHTPDAVFVAEERGIGASQFQVAWLPRGARALRHGLMELWGEQEGPVSL